MKKVMIICFIFTVLLSFNVYAFVIDFSGSPLLPHRFPADGDNLLLPFNSPITGTAVCDLEVSTGDLGGRICSGAPSYGPTPQPSFCGLAATSSMPVPSSVNNAPQDQEKTRVFINNKYIGDTIDGACNNWGEYKLGWLWNSQTSTEYECPLAVKTYNCPSGFRNQYECASEGLITSIFDLDFVELTSQNTIRFYAPTGLPFDADSHTLESLTLNCEECTFKTCETDYQGMCGTFDNGCRETITCTCDSGECTNGMCISDECRACDSTTCEIIPANEACGGETLYCNGAVDCNTHVPPVVYPNCAVDISNGCGLNNLNCQCMPGEHCSVSSGIGICSSDTNSLYGEFTANCLTVTGTAKTTEVFDDTFFVESVKIYVDSNLVTTITEFGADYSFSYTFLEGDLPGDVDTPQSAVITVDVIAPWGQIKHLDPQTITCGGSPVLGCRIESIKWDDCTSAKETIGAGMTTQFSVTLSGDGCAGKKVTFDVYENDAGPFSTDDHEESWDPDDIVIPSDEQTFSENWKALWQNDEGIGNPEFYIRAKLSSADYKESGLIEVRDCDFDNDKDCDGVYDNADSCVSDKCGEEVNPITGCSEELSACVALWDCSNVKWSSCDYSTNTVSRNVCSTGSTRNCCSNYLNLEKDCACKFGGSEEDFDNCGGFNLLTSRACIAEEPFPVFSLSNVVISVILLSIFYAGRRKFL